MLMMMWEDKNDYVIYKNIPDNLTALIYCAVKERKGFWRKCPMFYLVSSQEIEVLDIFIDIKQKRLQAWLELNLSCRKLNSSVSKHDAKLHI